MNPSEFMGAFLEEVSEQLTQMEQSILELEQRGAEDETIQVLFRAAHTLKGSCAAMGFESMTRLTHEMEQVLDEVRNHRLNVSDNLTHLLFRCCDNLKVFQESIEGGQEAPVDLSRLIEDLNTFLTDGPHESGDVPSTADVSKLNLNADLRLELEDAAQRGLRTYDVHVMFDDASVMRGIRAYLAHDRLSEVASVLATVPPMDEMEAMEDASLASFHMVAVGEQDSDGVSQAVMSSDFSQVTVTELVPARDGDLGSAGSAPEEPEANQLAATDATEGETSEGEVVRPYQERATTKRKSQTVRVDVEQLEALMNLVGELVIDQARIDQVSRVLGKRYKTDEDVRALDDIAGHVSRIVSELQENVMTARMVPIESLFNRFPRIVRDLSRTLCKQVNVTIEGHETRLDRTVIEEIADPLIHLVRNAVDHGLERPETRVALGKPETGNLRLTAAHEDNKVVLTVQDDGAGIYADKIRQSALRKGIISEDEVAKLTDYESLHLIFRPGFSTAEAVSDISGRGVGMDIVRNHIEKLSGSIEIETSKGQGTTFRIKLPLTLAIISGLLVGVSDRIFVLPLASVSEIVRVQPDIIQKVNGRPTILLRGQATPVVHLREYLQLPETRHANKQVLVVVVQVAEKKLAMVVDELHGNQDIVKKALGDRIGDTEGISGATILGDGRVGLILDVAGICKSSA